MNRTHNLARSDHDHLSVRVARQMQDAVSSAIAPRSRDHLYDDIVVTKKSIEHVHQRSVYSIDRADAFHAGDGGVVRVAL